MRGPDRFLVPRARGLRRDSTRAEAVLWEQLRSRRLDAMKFVRQQPVGPFIADFMCRERRLVIEVDGATHGSDAEIAYDRRRTEFLQEHGYRVLRLSNDEVINGMDEVLTVIIEALRDR